MTSATSLSAADTAARGSSTNWAWAFLQRSPKVSRSSVESERISRAETRALRASSWDSARLASPIWRTVRSYSGPKRRRRSALRRCLDRSQAPSARTATMTATAIMSWVVFMFSSRASSVLRRRSRAAAGTAALEGFRLGLERAAAEPSLPRLGQRLGWPDNSVDDDRKREEQWRERDDEGRGEISNQLHFAAVPHVAVRPHGRREPQHDQV